MTAGAALMRGETSIFNRLLAAPGAAPGSNRRANQKDRVSNPPSRQPHCQNRQGVPQLEGGPPVGGPHVKAARRLRAGLDDDRDSG